MADLRVKTGVLNDDDGSTERARFYYGADEAVPENRSWISAENHVTWVEEDGTVGIRRGTQISVGASAAYSANYDTIDWGN